METKKKIEELMQYDKKELIKFILELAKDKEVEKELNEIHVGDVMVRSSTEKLSEVNNVLNKVIKDHKKLIQNNIIKKISSYIN